MNGEICRRMFQVVFRLLNSMISDCTLWPLMNVNNFIQKFEENIKESLAWIMKLYIDNVQHMKKDIRWLEINIQDEQSIPFSFFQKLENEHESIKVEVQAK